MNPTHFEELLTPDGCPGLGRISPLAPIAVCHQEVIIKSEMPKVDGAHLGQESS